MFCGNSTGRLLLWHFANWLCGCCVLVVRRRRRRRRRCCCCCCYCCCCCCCVVVVLRGSCVVLARFLHGCCVLRCVCVVLLCLLLLHVSTWLLPPHQLCTTHRAICAGTSDVPLYLHLSHTYSHTVLSASLTGRQVTSSSSNLVDVVATHTETSCQTLLLVSFCSLPCVYPAFLSFCRCDPYPVLYLSLLFLA